MQDSKSTKDFTLSVVQKWRSSRSRMVKFAGGAGARARGAGCAFEGVLGRKLLEVGVDDVGLGDASID
jgi:hypothetical protein